MNNDIFNGLGIEIKFDDPENFLKIKETLTRMGIASKKDKLLHQSCHILHKQGKYAILHFKEMFLMDGKPSSFDNDDKFRRDRIVKLLEEWGLIEIIGQMDDDVETSSIPIKIIPFNEKSEWSLRHKYTIGKQKGLDYESI